MIFKQCGTVIVFEFYRYIPNLVTTIFANLVIVETDLHLAKEMMTVLSIGYLFQEPEEI